MTNLKNQALEAITPLVESLANAFMNLYNWLTEHPTVMQILVSVAIALATAFTVLAGALAIQGLIRGVTVAIQFLNTTLLANPIVLIVAAIAGLVAAFIYLWNNCDAFRQFWINLWENIKTAFWAVVEWIKTAASNIATFFVNAWNSIKEIWNGSLIGQYFNNIWTTIKNIFAVVKNVLSGNWRDAWNGIKNIVNTWKSYFSNVWSNIKSIFSGVGSWFGNIFRSAWNAVKNVFSNWGSFFGNLWTTIKNKFSSIGTNIANAISGAVRGGINGVISAIERTINSGIGIINGAIGLINKIPGVSVGTIGTVSFPRLAKGGIVDSPTFAQIGEDGREAVIPLERNTKWIDDLAQKIDERQNHNNMTGAVLSKLEDIYARLDRMQIVLDTGTLVGETIDKIDAGLATRQLLSERGV